MPEMSDPDNLGGKLRREMSGFSGAPLTSAELSKMLHDIKRAVKDYEESKRLKMEELRNLPPKPDPFLAMRENLRICLSAAVPLNIIEMIRRGGVVDSDVKFCHDFAYVLGEKGDLLMFRGKKPGESAKVFNGLARCLAIMSFCPGGVTLFGDRWESKDFERFGR